MERLAIVGCGNRCYYSFATKLRDNFKDKVEIVGCCDTNIKRCEYFRETINPFMKIYEVKDFDTMLDELKPDSVLVATPDCYHHEYISRAMHKGCDVYCEKPVTIDEEKCRAIRQAEKETGKKLTVTFNCRFQPHFAKIKELLESGVIGKPLYVNYHYMLHPIHGGDYFKRWHRFMEQSGGMLLHKSTHHFDVMNWILNDEPVTVSAQGARLFYGNDDRPHGKRCTQCAYTNECPTYQADMFDLDSMKALWLKAEEVDGYQRDHCAFESDTDIYDTMSVNVTYKSGAMMTYGICFYSTQEGYRIDIVGEKGRLTVEHIYTSYGYEQGGKNVRIIIHHRDGQTDEIVLPKPKGAHMGGDDKMFSMLFGGVKDDPLGQCADSFDGIKSAMVGIAANRSIKEGRSVNVAEILKELR